MKAVEWYFIVGVIPKEGLAGPQPANPRLGMTTTKTLRSVFSWRTSDCSKCQSLAEGIVAKWNPSRSLFIFYCDALFTLFTVWRLFVAKQMRENDTHMFCVDLSVPVQKYSSQTEKWINRATSGLKRFFHSRIMSQRIVLNHKCEAKS